MPTAATTTASSDQNRLKLPTRLHDEAKNQIKVIDLGLSLADVQNMGLEAEYQHHPKGQRRALEANLAVNGAGLAEIAFMFRDFDRLRSTRRVELNAMASPQFIAFVETKLREHGIAKIIPDRDQLNNVYASMERGRRLKTAVKDIDQRKFSHCEPPKDLKRRV